MQFTTQYTERTHNGEVVPFHQSVRLHVSSPKLLYRFGFNVAFTDQS
jgi:hypothetical protein